MIVTARQLEDLHRQHGSNGHVTLPYRARLTPLAADWVKSKRVVLGYSDIPQGQPAAAAASQPAVNGASVVSAPGGNAPAAGALLWWCDGPCGPAKAAVVAQERESTLRALDKPADAKQLVPVIRALAAEVKSGQSAGGVLLVQNGAAAMVLANRCPSLRAILGTCLDAVEQGISLVGANVLVIEYPHKTLQQVKNMLGRFVRGPRTLSEEIRRQIEELASCG